MLLILTLSALGGCGEGYVVKPAIFNISGLTNDSKGQFLEVVSRFLKQEGFEDLGRYDAMISLIQKGNMREDTKAEQIAKLNREHTFLNKDKHLRIVLVDYINTVPPNGYLSYTPPGSHFIEINIYEEQPGGFSPNGQNFIGRFTSILRQQYGNSLIVVKEPPPRDVPEYKRITSANTATTIFWCGVAMLVSFLVTGPISLFLLRKASLSATTKRGLFVLVNSWLIAPLPFPATVTTVPAPNILAFPWTNLDFYLQAAPVAMVSFPCALVLCTFVSFFLFEGNYGRK